MAVMCKVSNFDDQFSNIRKNSFLPAGLHHVSEAIRARRKQAEDLLNLIQARRTTMPPKQFRDFKSSSKEPMPADETNAHFDRKVQGGADHDSKGKLYGGGVCVVNPNQVIGAKRKAEEELERKELCKIPRQVEGVKRSKPLPPSLEDIKGLRVKNHRLTKTLPSNSKPKTKPLRQNPIRPRISVGKVVSQLSKPLKVSNPHDVGGGKLKVEISRKRAAHLAELRARFGGTILKAQQQKLSVEECVSLLKHDKKKEARERERQAARLALQKLEESVDGKDNMKIFEDLKALCDINLEVHPYGDYPLHRFGLILKQ
ncbi:hypothetical protein COLO4_10455 [Corchorus olitorius]|uniref:Uncharacterized protein n=1 Tax=Corchorus olitorius TaxID=93759 RepID=A0A1R3K8H1_9ROSI|nr:hypothetical protein COLO4_10455 [Corchorus olitorius]